jgi:hypothetical protein
MSALKKKIHPWRLCPIGEHWVNTHSMKAPPSKKHPAGSKTIRREHCAKNPSGKDQLYPDEIHEIAANHFKKLKTIPCPVFKKFPKTGGKFDSLIAGWTQYWNEVLKPADILSPNLVKALIASESGFTATSVANKKNKNSARGLLQITNQTRKILSDERGEINEHYITLTRDELFDANLNICAGIRWLFYKRDFASRKLKRQATWVEAVYEYKGASTVSKKRAEELVDRFLTWLGELDKCEK